MPRGCAERAVETGVHRQPANAFRRIAAAGVLFQGGAAAVDTGTVIAALVGWMTDSPLAVGTAAAIARYGWLLPQLLVGWLAEARARRMPFYRFGAFGRGICLALVAALVAGAGPEPGLPVVAGFFLLWTLYAFVSGVVAVPYNDIVARSVASAARSRLLAVRMFGGGLLALLVAAFAHRILGALPPHAAYASVLAGGAALFACSALFFVSAGEPALRTPPRAPRTFGRYLGESLQVWRADARFRRFVGIQWLGGAVQMVLPFYVVFAMRRGIEPADVGLLIGAQTLGAIVSNPLWGWWGDRLGKRSLIECVAAANSLAPLLVLAWVLAGADAALALPVIAGAFFVLGAAGNGNIIAQLGYLMEISPDDRRPSYSGYFNAFVAPASLLPLAAAGLLGLAGFETLLVVALSAAVLQHLAARGLRKLEVTVS